MTHVADEGGEAQPRRPPVEGPLPPARDVQRGIGRHVGARVVAAEADQDEIGLEVPELLEPQPPLIRGVAGDAGVDHRRALPPQRPRVEGDGQVVRPRGHVSERVGVAHGQHTQLAGGLRPRDGLPTVTLRVERGMRRIRHPHEVRVAHEIAGGGRDEQRVATVTHLQTRHIQIRSEEAEQAFGGQQEGQGRKGSECHVDGPVARRPGGGGQRRDSIGDPGDSAPPGEREACILAAGPLRMGHPWRFSGTAHD
jgi:hypothetical protein